MAQHDPLTGLPNRTLFHFRLTQSIERCRRNKVCFAVMYLDIDHFKSINDTFGHAAGDQLLKTFADRLSGCIRASDMAARLGGDEFAVILEEIARPDHAANVARKVLAAMRTAFELGEIEVPVTTSIGIAIVNGNTAHTSLNDLLANADMALYEAKASGRSTYRFSANCGVT
jgi:diguanylate cyclase (GGDEF)-like protein